MNTPGSPCPGHPAAASTGRAQARTHPALRPTAWLLSGSLLIGAALPAWAQQPAAGARLRNEPVTLNFVNAEIEGVSRAMAAILGQQFIVDPRVKGQITLYSETPLSPQQAYRNFLSALRGLGFTVVEVGGLYKVVPEADAKLQAGTVSIGETVSRRGDQVLTQIFKLDHENANNLVPVLRPLITPNNTINANPGSNTLVITDYADNLARIAKIIAAMDVPGTGDVEVIPLRHAVASDIAALVQRLSDASASSAAPGTAAPATSGSGPAVLVDARSNSLLVRAPSPARMVAIRSLVERLDRPLAGNGAGGMWVIPLRNADAVKLATVLRAAFASAGGGSSASGASGLGSSSGSGSSLGGLATGSSTSLGGTSSSTGSSAAGASPQSTTPVGASPSPSTGGFIQADPSTNSLVVTAAEPLYRQIRAMVEQLDGRRAQIYIESMIVEVTGDNAADFGFQWQGLSGSSGDSTGLIGGTNFGSTGNLLGITAAQAAGTLTSSALGQGLNIGLIRNFAGTYGIAAIARILQSQTNTNIVSTPNLITLDNEEAKIVVGQNVPFVTGQYTNTGTSTSNPFQTIERKDVGITLRIRPQVGEGGTVRMVIYQESSSVADTVAVGTDNAGPTTNKRSIESTVTVDDGQIMVLGGLIEDRFTENKSKVPLLGDIPYVGALFRSESRTKRRTNLMVFLRPVVMRDNTSSTQLTLDRYDIIRARQQAAQPVPSVMIPINESPVLPPRESLNPGGPVPVRPLEAPMTPAPAASAPLPQN